MNDETIERIEQWLREQARTPERPDDESSPTDAAEPAPEQERPYWPYLESEDFWRQ